MGNIIKNEKKILFEAYLQGKRDQIYWPTEYEKLTLIGKYRIIKQFLKWYYERMTLEK